MLSLAIHEMVNLDTFLVTLSKWLFRSHFAQTNEIGSASLAIYWILEASYVQLRIVRDLLRVQNIII